MKRQKFSIWDREPDTKKGCYEFYQAKKKSWPLNYVLNEEETKHVKEMMSKYYYSPIKPHMVQDLWHANKDNIIEIKVTYHEIYGSSGGTRLEFWIKKPTHRMYDFSVARCICFKGDGLINESERPKPAVLEALKNAIADEKIDWKKSQGYRPGIDPLKHAHHIDGKEFKTIFIKFLNEIKMTNEDFVNLVYPTHGDFETSLIKYADNGTGWRFKNNNKANTVSSAFWQFHYRNREYELVDPIHHRDITSEEIKFNTEIRNKIKDII
tara:strand:- start:45 stop:845 length:801 start_codon:yes stop_codon:yes gene_type:complete